MMGSSLYTSSSKKKILLKVIIFLVVVGMLDYVIGAGLRCWFFSQTSGPLYRTTYALEYAEEDVFIIGDSRATNHYVPRILSAQLGMSVYNAGRGGQGIVFFEALSQTLLKRHVPKMIILEATYTLFPESPWDFSRLNELLPYVDRHPELRDVVSLRGPFERVRLLSRIYPFNGLLSLMLQSVFSVEEDENGFVPRTRAFDEDFWRRVPATESTVFKLVAPKKKEALQKLLSAAHEAGVKVCIVMSPLFSSDAMIFGEKEILDPLLYGIANQYDVRIMDYLYDERFLGRKEYFSDPQHLNYRGAKEFSRIVAHDIAAEDAVAIDG